jgi:hypothetical protein
MRQLPVKRQRIPGISGRLAYEALPNFRPDKVPVDLRHDFGWKAMHHSGDGRAIFDGGSAVVEVFADDDPAILVFIAEADWRCRE